jgi:hypothetical protein
MAMTAEEAEEAVSAWVESLTPRQCGLFDAMKVFVNDGGTDLEFFDLVDAVTPLLRQELEN